MRNALKEFANGLKDIRDTKCWQVRGNLYSSFDDYCRKNFKFGERQGNYLIVADDFKKLMLEAGGSPQELDELKETHIRPLIEAKVAPEKALEVIREAKQENTKLTANAVREKLSLPVKQATAKTLQECPSCHHKF